MPHGPCIVCGATNYPLSMGGPNICPPCDCGISPKVTKLKIQLNEKISENFMLKEVIKQQTAMLKTHEWSDGTYDTEGVEYCKTCGSADYNGHADDCLYNNAIKSGENALNK